jgi:hypothetical protein
VYSHRPRNVATERLGPLLLILGIVVWAVRAIVILESAG